MSRIQRVIVEIALAVMVMLIALIDYATGVIPDLSDIYLVPLSLSAFLLGLPYGLIMVVVVVVIDSIVRIALLEISPIGIMSRTFVFAFVVVLIDRLKLQSQRIRVLGEKERESQMKREVADTLQRSLLVMPKRIPNLAFACLYRSASKEPADVGGDFYDLFEIGGGRVCVLIGDISGKGLQAATATSLVKFAIRAYAHTDQSPASIMAKTNHLVVESTSSTLFSTIFFGILDLGTGALTYTNAGHPPPVLKRRSSQISLLSEASPVAGAFDNMDFVEGELTLDQGDILVLYTDGAIEARRDNDLFGEERLIDCIKGPVSLEKLPERILSEVLAFSSNMLSDDLALLAIAIKNQRKESSRQTPNL